MLKSRIIITGLFLSVCLIGFTQPVLAGDTDGLTKVLSQVDAKVCSAPKDLPQHYTKDMVIIFDDKRIMLDSRIKDYEGMMSDLVGLKCKVDRKILSKGVGSKSAFILVDEMVSITSKSGHIDERQHSVCTYGFLNAGGTWKIAHEHCSSLPDYTIVPGDDALYYFHNPIY